MRKVYTTQDTLMIGHLKNVLKTRGIDCVIRNLYLTGATGQLPPIECWPELWVVNDVRYLEAQDVLKRALAPIKIVRKPWTCARCGEESEGQFAECWNCGSKRF
ncbi:MAG: DUF2007 domain-containing protein [Candidatus Binatia bacterium]